MSAGKHLPVDDLMAALLRQKSPAERTRLASIMFSNARDMLRGYLKEQHPRWSQLEIHRELLRRIHGTA